MRAIGLSLLLCAAACGGATTGDLVGTQDVAGVVVDASGVPLPGSVVTIAGHTPVVADAEGAFRVRDVVAPYTVRVAGPGIATVYSDLAAARPRLVAARP